MHLNAGYKAVDECIWEYDVMGLVSISKCRIVWMKNSHACNHWNCSGCMPHFSHLFDCNCSENSF